MSSCRQCATKERKVFLKSNQFQKSWLLECFSSFSNCYVCVFVCYSPWHSKYLIGTFKKDDAWAQITTEQSRATMDAHRFVILLVLCFFCGWLLFFFSFLSCCCCWSQEPCVQIKSFFYLKRSESGWRLHAREHYHKMNEAKWLMTTGYMGMLVAFLFALYRSSFFLYIRNSFYLTPRPNSEMHTQQPKLKTFNRFDVVAAATRWKICSD